MIKKIIVNIECFLLILFLFILLILTIFLNTVFDKNYILNVLENNSYYETKFDNLEDIIDGYTLQLGLDVSVFKNLITKEKIRNDIKIVIDGIYDNKEINIDTNVIKEKLNYIISNRLKENNRIPLKEEQEAIHSFINSILEVYEDEIIYSKDLVFKIKENFLKLKNFIKKIVYFLSFVSISILFTIIVFDNDFKLTFRKIGIVLLTTSLLLITIWLLLRYRFQHILLISNLLSKVVINIINDIISNCLYLGSIIGLIGLILIICSSIEKNKFTF